MNKQLYSTRFFDGQVSGSLRSAGVVVPIVLSLFPIKSVVDVGCGVAPWAATFLKCGVSDVLAIDGDYVDRGQLQVPTDMFLARDLESQLELDRKFDLCVCLEVAEHLSSSRAESFVSDLTCLADCVLFSAAIPGPTGTGHINAQFLPYWVSLFAKQGYEAVDPIRPKIWGNDSVEWFYRQNTVIFVAPGHPVLKMGFPRPLSMIHSQFYLQVLNAPPTLAVIGKLPAALVRSIKYRLGEMRVGIADTFAVLAAHETTASKGAGGRRIAKPLNNRDGAKTSRSGFAT